MNVIEIIEDGRIIGIFYDTDLKATHQICKAHNAKVQDIKDLWTFKFTEANIAALVEIDEMVGESI
jgi:hypothetical protein